MRIYIVRHGETDANNKAYLQGWSDDPLNENGRMLAELTGQGMKSICFDYCISSPLQRAKDRFPHSESTWFLKYIGSLSTMIILSGLNALSIEFISLP